MKELRAKLNEINTLLGEFQKDSDTMTQKEIGERVVKIKAARAELQQILTNGAKDCEPVESSDAEGKPVSNPHRPIGIFHEGTANPFEIGDPVTPNRRVRAAFLEDAVEKWNKDEWLPPRAPETVKATHRDKDGKVISEKEVKLQRK